jgi:hypothetical protein
VLAIAPLPDVLRKSQFGTRRDTWISIHRCGNVLPGAGDESAPVVTCPKIQVRIRLHNLVCNGEFLTVPHLHSAFKMRNNVVLLKGSARCSVDPQVGAHVELLHFSSTPTHICPCRQIVLRDAAHHYKPAVPYMPVGSPCRVPLGTR